MPSPRPDLRNEEVEHQLRGKLREIAAQHDVEVPALHKETLHVSVDDDEHPLVAECQLWLQPCIGGSVPRATVEAMARERLGLDNQEKTAHTTSLRVPNDPSYCKIVLTFADDGRLAEYVFIDA